MLWLKLTSYDGSALRVNMFQAQNYYSHSGEGGNTFIEMASLADETRGLHVQEKIEDIDNAIVDVASPLRIQLKADVWG